jgi:MscS family membrane protein
MTASPRPSLAVRLLRTIAAQPVFALLLLACVPVCLAAAKSQPREAQGGESAVQEESQSAGLESPRASLNTFLENVVAWREQGNEAELNAALRALDMQAFPAADRAYLGQQFAARLLELFDKIGRVDPSQLPDASASPQSGRYVWEFAREDRPEVSIEVEFARGAEGQWRISGKTLNRIAGWKAEYAAVPMLDDLAKQLSFQDWLRSVMPPALQKRIAFLEAWQWIGMGVLVLLGILAQRIASFFFVRFVTHVTSSERLALDAKLLTRVARPIALLATSIAFVAGIPLLDLNPRGYHIVSLLANIGLTVALVWTAYRLVDVLSWVMAQRAARTEGRFDDMLVPLVRRTLKVVVVILGVVLMITRMDSDLWGLVAGLSIGSLAVGFAAKGSIENLFGTFTVLMDKPFQLGDLVLVDGIEGTVEDVGFRSTRVRTAEDSLITVPNSRFISAHVENRGLRRFRRVRTLLGLTYDTPPEKIDLFCEGIRELIRQHPYTRKANYHIWMHGFGASSLDLQLTVFFDVPDWATENRERHRLYLNILRLSESIGVSFAFPTQTVHMTQTPPAEPATEFPRETLEVVNDARRISKDIAEQSMRPFAGKRPGPVSFDSQDPDAAGHGKIGG